MQIAEQQSKRSGVSLEIRARWPHAVARHDDLLRLGVQVSDVRRLIVVDAAEVLRETLEEQQDVLLDLLVEEIVSESDALPYVDVFYKPGVTDSEGEAAALVLGLAAPLLRGIECRSGQRYRFDEAVGPEIRGAVERLLGNPLIQMFRWSDSGEEVDLFGAGDEGYEARFAESEPVRSGTLVPLRGAATLVPELGEDAGSIGAATVRGHVATSLPGEQGGIDRPWVERIALGGLDDAALLRVSREHGLALDGVEMQAIAAHFAELGRDPSDVELQSLAQTWSEHCSHKTFKATIDLRHDGATETIGGLLTTCIATPSLALQKPWVRSAFADNAGIVAFDDRYDLAFKVETHNHPSALEPFGGAHTGVGGVIRDVLAVSADPIANTDVLCFGPLDLPEDTVPPGVFHPATTCVEVVRGVADYGNNMGIPTVGGAILFHPGYVSNPLVYCGTAGLLPHGSHPTEPRPGDAVVLLGGRTGRDGLHGATMSSTTLDRDRVEGTVVQIGNPITEKGLRDVLPHLRDERLYHAITDCGAGGLCSAVGEMGGELGVDVDLTLVPRKYPGLTPWEVWLSEAQERLVLAVPPESLGRTMEICAARDVELSVIGRFRDDGMLFVRHGDDLVARLDMSFLHGGRPPRRMEAVWNDPPVASYTPDTESDPGERLLEILRHPTIASKEDVIRRYDHEVGAVTVIKPLVGDAGPSDAAVLKPLPGSWRGVAIAHGINPLFGADPHAMAMLAVDEALRNLVAVGGDIERTALLDNFCWGDVSEPEQLGGLARAAQGCGDAAVAYGTPFISGKDSLYNRSAGEGSIPGTLLISAIGVVGDIRHTATMDLKEVDNLLYLLGCTAEEMGGSFALWLHGRTEGRVPAVRPEETVPVMRRLTAVIGGGLVRACHDLSEGGLAVAAAEMAIAGGLGLEIDLEKVPMAAGVPHEPTLPTVVPGFSPTAPEGTTVSDATHEGLKPGTTPETTTSERAKSNSALSNEALLFAESAGRFLVEVPPEHAELFEAAFGALPCARVGTVIEALALSIRRGERSVLDLPLDDMSAAWRRR